MEGDRQADLAGLRPAERLLVERCKEGGEADYRAGTGDDPAQCDRWGDDRTLSAEFIYSLVMRQSAHCVVHPRGVRIRGVRITGTLDFQSAKIEVPFALIDCSIENALILTDASVPLLCLTGTRVAGLRADGLIVTHNIFLDKNFRADGEVRLVGAKVAGSLICDGGKFNAPDMRHCAINADGIQVDGSVQLRGIEASGAVQPRDRFIARGAVRMVGAKIGTNLDCHGATFEFAAGDAFNIAQASVGATLTFTAVSARGKVNLGSAKVGRLLDDSDSWPQELILNGFTYESLAGGAPVHAGGRSRPGRLDWLRRQPREPENQFLPQPYEQLTKVLRQMGHEREARLVAIGKYKELRRSDELGWWGWLGNWLLYITIGYGHRTWQVLVPIICFLLLGTLVFSSAYRSGIIKYSQKSSAGVQTSPPPPFEPMLFSLDTFVPFLDLGQKSDFYLFRPNGNDVSYWLFQVYLILHTLAGYTLTGLIIAASTGLIKKE